MDELQLLNRVAEFLAADPALGVPSLKVWRGTAGGAAGPVLLWVNGVPRSEHPDVPAALRFLAAACLKAAELVARTTNPRGPVDGWTYLLDLFRHAAGTVIGLAVWRELRRERRAEG